MELNHIGFGFIVIIVSRYFLLKEFSHLWPRILPVITIRNMASLPMCKAQLGIR